MESTAPTTADTSAASFSLDPEYSIDRDDIEAALKSFKAKVKLQNEPVADTAKLLKLLQQVALNQKTLFQDKESFEKFFMKDVVPGFVKTLALSIKINIKDNQWLELVKQIPEALAYILVNNMGDAELWDGVAKFFDHKNRIFTYHFLAEENHILQQNSLDLFSLDQRAWRQSLQAGTELDAIKLDTDGKKQIWSRATVKERKGDNVVVSFDWVTSERELNIYSMNIAEVHSKSKEEFEWRENLKAGELFECWDSTGSWYACTALQIQEKEHQGLQTTMVHVAYRVYREDGDKSDEKGKYFGWEPEYDDWVHLYSPKLAKYLTHTDGTLQSQTKEAQENSGKSTATKTEETNFDDSMDLTVLKDSQGNRIYAVQRKECKSDLINGFLNTFGRLGGFDLMLTRMREVNQDQLELYLVSSYIEAVAYASPLFHKQFVNEYFSQFLEAVKQSLLGSSKAQLRLLKYDKINKIIEILFGKFVTRFDGMTPLKQKTLLFEFQVDLGIHFLRQDFLEKRIDGVKIIGQASFDCLDGLKTTEKGQPTAKVTENPERMGPARELVKKLLDNDFILDELFSSTKTHTQLVQRSEKVLRLLFGLEALSEIQLDFIWKTTDQNDVFLETDILKSLTGAAQDMSVRDMSFFINKIKEIKVEDLSERYLQLIIEMGSMKHVEKEETIQNQILNMLWSITFESEGKTNLMVVNSSSLAFSKRIRSLFFNDQLTFMYKLVDKLKQNQSGQLVLKTLYGILRNSCDPPAQHPEYETLTDVINHLESKKGLLEIIFENFKHYSQKVNERIKNKEVDEKNLESQVIWDMFMHSDQITQRLEFIKFYVQKSPQVQMKCRHLECLWDILIINSRVASDQKQLMQWLREICDQVERLNLKNEHQPFVSIEEITKFYHSRIASLEGKSDDTFKHMNIEGFQCRQSFFVLVNSIQGRLRKVNWESGMFKKDEGDQSQATGTFKDKATKSFTSFNNETGASYSSYSFNKTEGETTSGGTQTQPMIGPQKPVHMQQQKLEDKDEDPDDLEVESVVSPGELDGMNMLWMIATESTSKNVIDAAAKLLISLHHGVARDLKERIPEFDDLFINKIFEIIQAQLPEIKNRSKEDTDKFLAEQAALSPYASTIQQLKVMPLAERKIVRSLFLLRQMVRASEKDGTYGLRPHSALNKGAQLPNLQIANSFSGFQNKHHRNRFEISIDSNCTVWELKKRIGQELIKTSQDDGKTWDVYPLEGETEPPLPLHPACIRLFQLQSSKDIQDLNHGSTLAELNLKTNENLGVFKKSHQLQRKAPIVRKFEDGTYGLTQRANQIANETFQKFSKPNDKGEGIIDKPSLILYTAACTNTPSDENDYRVNNFMQKYDKDQKGFVFFNEFMQFYIDSVTGGNELALRNNFENLGYGPNLEKLPVSGDEDNILQVRRSAKEMPRFKVSQNQQQFGILMQLMSIGGEVSKRAAEAINTHVTNPVLYREVLKIESDFSQDQEYDWGTIFDKSNVHQMIYSLEIIQALLVGQNDKERIKKFILSFVNKGGLKQLQQRLTEGLESISQDNTFYQKMYLDRLLQLIKIFVSSGKVAEEKPQEFDLEIKEDEEDKTLTTPTKPILRAKIASGDIVVTQYALFGDDGDNNPEEQEMKQIDAQKEKESDQRAAAIQKQESLNLNKVLSSQDIIDSISSKIDLNLLKQQSIKLMELFIAAKDFDSKDRPIVETSLQLWQKIESEDGSDKPVDISSHLISRGLIQIGDKKIREAFLDSVIAIAKVKPSLHAFLIDFINETLQTLVTKQSDVATSTGQFFDLVAKLLAMEMEPALERYQLLEVLVQLLRSYEAKETAKSLICDQTLFGTLETITAIITELKKQDPASSKLQEFIDQTDLVNILLYRCLFFQEGKSEKYINAETQKAKSQCASKDCRKAGFRVLKAIVGSLKPKEMNDFITTHLMPIVNEVQRPSRWRHLPSSQNRENGYCGIVNLGCICYMISILQQFYMVPAFRYQVMKAVDKTPENIGEFKDEKFDDNLLKQLQILYGYLEISERQAASAKGMCFSYKDFDGLPTKIGEQKDSQEFLNFFVDRIEEQLKPTTQKHLINDIFRGTQCDQIICQSCGRIRNKFEQFCNLSLEVQGMKGVYQSLDHMKKGEILEGYHCEGCDQRVNATKRQIIGKTPNMLILHLKRFVFSFDTYQNEKVNSYFEFPQVLDLKKYSVKENIDDTTEEDIKNLKEVEDDEFIYRLVGINIQEGSASSGHYYSFINTLRGDMEHDPYADEEKWQKVNLNPWREFNDSKIGIFNFDRDIEKEAYGGESTKDNNVGSTLTDDELGKFLSLGSGGYGKSAYMLFYERKKKSNLTEFTDDSQQETQVVDYRQVPKVVPEWISDLVKKDNKSFLVDSQVFDEQFFDFIKEMFKVIQDLLMNSHTYSWPYNRENYPILKNLSVDLLGKTVFDMLCYYDRNIVIQPVINSASSIMTFCDSVFYLKEGLGSSNVNFLKKFFIDDAGAHFFKIMFHCTDINSRINAGKLLATALTRVIKLYDEFSEEDKTKEAFVEVKSVIDKSLDLIFGALMTKECMKAWTKLEAYFDMILEIGKSCFTAKQILLDRSDIISDIIDFILGNKSPRAVHETEKRHVMGGVAQPAYSPLFNFISLMIRMVYTSQMDATERLPSHYQIMENDTKYNSAKTYFLTDEAVIMLTKTDFLERVIFETKYTECEEFAQALCHLCYKNLNLTRKVCKRFLKALSYSNNDQAERHLILLVALLQVKDQYQIHRLEYLFGFPFLMQGGDQPFNISTGLDSRQYDDSVLNLLWKYKGRLQNFSLTILEKFGEIITSDRVIYDYMARLPSINSMVCKYTDWIMPFLDEQTESTQKYSAGSGTDEKLTKIALIRSKFEEYFSRDEDLENRVPDNLFWALHSSEQMETVRTETVDDAIEITIKRVRGTYAYQDRPQESEVSTNAEESKAEPDSKGPQEDIEAFDCEDLCYQVYAKNLKQANLKVKFDFQEVGEEASDLVYPVGGLKDFLKPNAEVLVITLRRRFPDKKLPTQIDLVKLNVRWKNYNQDDFTVGNYSTITASSVKVTSTTTAAATSTSITTNQTKDSSGRRGGILLGPVFDKQNEGVDSSTKQEAGNSPINLMDEYAAAENEAKKSCPACTLDNPVSALNCSLCDTLL